MHRAGTAVCLAVLVVVAGCSGPGQRTPEAITAEASKASVADAALEETGYREVSATSRPFNDSGTISVSGDVELSVQYRLRGTAWSAVYRGEGDPAPVFAVLSVPQVRPEEVAVAVNPLADRSTADVATTAQDRYRDVEDVRHVENRTATVLGNETTVSVHRATATVDGDSVEVTVAVASVRVGTDVVVAVAISPRDADESGAVTTLLEAIDHPDAGG